MYFWYFWAALSVPPLVKDSICLFLRCRGFLTQFLASIYLAPLLSELSLPDSSVYRLPSEEHCDCSWRPVSSADSPPIALSLAIPHNYSQPKIHCLELAMGC